MLIEVNSQGQYCKKRHIVVNRHDCVSWHEMFSSITMDHKLLDRLYTAAGGFMGPDGDMSSTTDRRARG